MPSTQVYDIQKLVEICKENHEELLKMSSNCEDFLENNVMPELLSLKTDFEKLSEKFNDLSQQ